MIIIILYILLLITSLVWSFYLIKALRSYHQIPILEKKIIKKSNKSQSFISVIIPTRNEGNRIGKCIQSIKSQTYPNIEFIIVDDSMDDTVQIIKSIIGNDKRFKIVKQEKLPHGWIGKPHALQQGSTKARGKWLVFIDADTYHDPELLSTTVDYIKKNNLDMLSVLLGHICKTFWEKVIQPIPIGMLIILGPVAKVNNPNSKAAIASGPFMVIKRTVFNKVGGYKTIKNRIGDDAEIAKLIKNSGFKIDIVHAQTLVKVRMYERFSEIWNGWSKNSFFGLVQIWGIQSKPLQFLILLGGMIGIFIIIVLPIFIMIGTALLTLFTYQPQWYYLLIFSSLIWLFSLIVQIYAYKRYNIGDPRFVPLTFLGGIIFIGIFLNSALKTWSRKGVIWKGRRYTA